MTPRQVVSRCPACGTILGRVPEADAWTTAWVDRAASSPGAE